MKKSLLTILTVSVFFANSSLAGKGHPANEEERAERMERTKQHLELSDEQVAEMRRIREEGGGREEVRAVLDEEQQEKWDQARQRHRKQKHSREGE